MNYQSFIKNCWTLLLVLLTSVTAIAQESDSAAGLGLEMGDFFVVVMSAIAGAVLVATVFVIAKAIATLGGLSNKNINL